MKIYYFTGMRHNPILGNEPYDMVIVEGEL